MYIKKILNHIIVHFSIQMVVCHVQMLVVTENEVICPTFRTFRQNFRVKTFVLTIANEIREDCQKRYYFDVDADILPLLKIMHILK